MSEINKNCKFTVVQDQIILYVSTGLSTKKGFTLTCSLANHAIVDMTMIPSEKYIPKNFGIEIASQLTTLAQNTTKHKTYNQVLGCYSYHSQLKKNHYCSHISNDIKELFFNLKVKQHQLISYRVKDDPTIILQTIDQLISDYSIGKMNLKTFIHEYFKLLETSFFHKNYIRSSWINDSINNILFCEDKAPLTGFKKLLYKMGIDSKELQKGLHHDNIGIK